MITGSGNLPSLQRKHWFSDKGPGCTEVNQPKEEHTCRPTRRHQQPGTCAPTRQNSSRRREISLLKWKQLLSLILTEYLYNYLKASCFCSHEMFNAWSRPASQWPRWDRDWHADLMGGHPPQPYCSSNTFAMNPEILSWGCALDIQIPLSQEPSSLIRMRKGRKIDLLERALAQESLEPAQWWFSRMAEHCLFLVRFAQFQHQDSTSSSLSHRMA